MLWSCWSVSPTRFVIYLSDVHLVTFSHSFSSDAHPTANNIGTFNFIDPPHIVAIHEIWVERSFQPSSHRTVLDSYPSHGSPPYLKFLGPFVSLFLPLTTTNPQPSRSSETSPVASVVPLLMHMESLLFPVPFFWLRLGSFPFGVNIQPLGAEISFDRLDSARRSSRFGSSPSSLFIS